MDSTEFEVLRKVDLTAPVAFGAFFDGYYF